MTRITAPAASTMTRIIAEPNTTARTKPRAKSITTIIPPTAAVINTNQ